MLGRTERPSQYWDTPNPMNKTMKQTTIMTTLTLAAALVAGCSTNSEATKSSDGAIGMANPASVHCQNKGGKLSIRKDKDGNETGICHLPDGTQVEEWELFRRDNPQSSK